MPLLSVKIGQALSHTVYQKDNLSHEKGYHFDMTVHRSLLYGFLIGLAVFLLANLLAAHLLSDCGLPAVLGMDSCADDIARAGFPLVFFEEGGFAFRSIFNLPYLLLDIFIGISVAIICSLVAKQIAGRKSA